MDDGSAFSALERYDIGPDDVDSIVRGAAQYLARSWLGNGKAGPADDAEYRTYVRGVLREMATYGVRVPTGPGTEDALAAAMQEAAATITEEMVTEVASRATTMAERVAETNVNWDQWAFGR